MNAPKQGLDDYLANNGTVQALRDALMPAADLNREMTRDPSDPMGPYRQDDGGIVYLRTARNGETTEERLTNFRAQIVEDLATDDGGNEMHHVYVIEVRRGNRVHRVRVPAEAFGGMRWVAGLGAEYVVRAGNGRADQVREAIQRLSIGTVQTRHVYAHTGWIARAGHPVFLHAGGGIDASGDVPGLSVDLGETLAHYALPPVPAGEAEREAIRATLGLLDVAPRRIVLTLLGAVFRSPLGPCRVSVHLFGETGTGKTELAALMQQHFGGGWAADILPGSWNSTDNALEDLQHRARHVLFVIDDFVSASDSQEQGRMNRRADRVFRGAGNGSARQRMRADGTLRPARPPMGMTLSTGEDRPRGQSLAARRLDLEVRRSDVDWLALTQAQQHGAAGLYAGCMAGFIRFLAGYPKTEIDAMLGTMAQSLRGHLSGLAAHRRIPDAAAQIASGWAVFLQYAAGCSAISEDERAAYWDELGDCVDGLAAIQGELQADGEPAHRYLQLLDSAIASGRAHVCSPDGGEPENAVRWGWRNGMATGALVGWIDGDDLFVEPEAAFAVVRQVADAGGEPFPIREAELRRRLDERALLMSREAERGRLTIRKTLSAARRNVLHVRWPPPSQKPSQPSQPSYGGAYLAGRRPIPEEDSGTVAGDDRPNPVPQKMANSRPPEMGLGQLGRMGQFPALGGPVTVDRSVCAHPHHLTVWSPNGGEAVCVVCHPPPFQRSAS